MRITDFATEVLNIVGRGGEHVDEALRARLLPDETTPANNPGIINRAILRIARNWPWRELRVVDSETFKATQDQEHVDISAAGPIRCIVSVRVMDEHNSRKLIRIEDVRTKDDLKPDPAVRPKGTPSRYAEDNLIIDEVRTRCLVLDPLPNKDYDLTIRYSKWPDVYEEEDTPELTQIDDVILNLSVSMTYSAIAEYPQAVYWYVNQYMPCLEEAVQLETTQPDWDMIWLGHTRPPDLGRSLDLNPWQDPFVFRL